MLNTMLSFVENVIVIVVVGVSLHYLGGLDWPWAILIGAAVLVALRWLLPSVRAARPRVSGRPGSARTRRPSEIELVRPESQLRSGPEVGSSR